MAEILIYADKSYIEDEYQTRRAKLLLSPVPTLEKDKAIAIFDNKYNSRNVKGDPVEVRENGGFNKTPLGTDGAGWRRDKFALFLFPSLTKAEVETFVNAADFHTVEYFSGHTKEFIRQKRKYKFNTFFKAGEIKTFTNLKDASIEDKNG